MLEPTFKVLLLLEVMHVTRSLTVSQEVKCLVAPLPRGHFKTPYSIRGGGVNCIERFCCSLIPTVGQHIRSLKRCDFTLQEKGAASDLLALLFGRHKLTHLFERLKCSWRIGILSVKNEVHTLTRFG